MRRIAILVCVLASCASTSRSTPGEAVPGPTSIGETDEAGVSRETEGGKREPAVWVVSESGVGLYELDGTLRRQLSKRGAEVGVDTADGFVVWGSNSLRYVSKEDGQEKELYRLENACSDPSEVLSVQESEGMWATAETVCVELLDRNINMANVWVRVIYDLKAGIGEEFVVMAGCGLSEDVEAPQCPNYKSRGRSVQSKPMGDFGIIDGRLAKKDNGKWTPQSPILYASSDDKFKEEQHSPSGRYTLVSGDGEDGDYLYLRYLVLDRQNGELFYVDSNIVPEAIGSKELAAHRSEEGFTAFHPGDYVPYWLAEHDLLAIDAGTTLWFPTKASVRFPGQIMSVADDDKP